MTDDQAARIIEQLDTIIELLQPKIVPPQSLLFRDVWPTIIERYDVPARVRSAIKWELLSEHEVPVKKYQTLTMKEFMENLRLGEAFVRGLGPVSAQALYQILKDFDVQ